jgi:uncharacterized membrane protein
MVMDNESAVAGFTVVARDITIRKITIADLTDSLRRGIQDFREMPTEVIFLAVIYPVIAFFLARFVAGYRILPVFFPLLAGFALIGPVAALGLYELSRRREKGLDNSWWHVFDVLKSPALPDVVVIALFLLGYFISWISVATVTSQAILGTYTPDSIEQFLGVIFGTWRGWTLIIVGNGIGLLFAVQVLAFSVVSFPLLLDRDVGTTAALAVSATLVRRNPVTMAVWGMIVAASLAIGALPFLLGLAVVIPVLGHATWHLYRKAVT